jgi:hypothetical protein
MTSYDQLINNFEFEYIFSFLPINEIVKAQRVSKIFKKQLTNKDFWEDVSLCQLKKKLDYKESLKAFKTTSIYIIGEKTENIFVNLPYFNDKKKKKILICQQVVMVLTEDGKLHKQNLNNLEKSIGELFPSSDLISDFAFQSPDSFVFCTDLGEAHFMSGDLKTFKCEGYISKVEVHREIAILFDEKKRTAHLFSIWDPTKVVEKVTDVLKVNSSGLVLNGEVFYNFFLKGKEKVKGPFGQIIKKKKKKQVNQENNKELKNFYVSRMPDSAIKLLEFVDESFELIGFYGKENISLKDRVVKIFSTDGFFYFLTDKNEVFMHSISEKETNSSSYGIQTFTSFFRRIPKGFQKTNIFPEGFGKIQNITGNFYFMVVEFGKYESAKSEKQLNKEKMERLQKHLNEKEKIDKELQKCLKCNCMYWEPENTETSCKFHPGHIYSKKVYYDTYDDVYYCCDGSENSTGCVSQRHSFK